MDFGFFNNYADAVLILSRDNEIVFKNKNFDTDFSSFKSLERFKKCFNFNLCFLSTEKIKETTPLDILLKSDENFHTICTYQNQKDELINYYLYSFIYKNYKVVIFKNITTDDLVETLSKKYNELSLEYKKINEYGTQAGNQALKMGIINRIFLVIRETNDIESILNSVLLEIHNFFGAFKTYFSLKNGQYFKILNSVTENSYSGVNTIYESEILSMIKNKDIIVNSCLKEFQNSKEILPKGVTRIIIPVHNRNKILGIIVILTKQKFSLEDNREILESISVQLASSLIQSGLISQLNKKNKKLEKILKELKEAQIQLINSEKMASLGQLVSGIAHEINTPLASIQSNNNLIKKILTNSENIQNNQTDMLKELNNIDIEAAQRISEIVKSLKRFVRLDEAEFQKADINKELDLTLKIIEHETKNNIKIIKKYSQIPPIYCSVNMINQVFMNILVNACHSIKEKGKEGVITVKTEYSNNNLIVKIKDSGMGIKDNIKNKIFNVGFTTKKIGVGTGFGLAISKKIIEFHKGSISFETKENEGSEFTVIIPNMKIRV